MHRNDRDHAGGKPDMHIELEPADQEEPTWEVRAAGDGRRRRLDRRTRAILICAGAAAIVVNAGAAWAYWRVTGSDTAGAGTGAGAVSMALRARSDLDQPLRPGETSDLIVTVTNDYDFPVRIHSLAPGRGNIVADDEHRDAGCTDAAVAITQPRFEVNWEVRRNTIGAFTVPDGLVMSPNVDPACVGAVFTVPVQVSGERQDGA